MLEFLRMHDEVLFDACCLKLQAVFPTNLLIPDSGSSTALVEITSMKGIKALTLTKDRIDPAIYPPLREKGTVDLKGNLQVCQHQRMFVYLGHNSWKTRYDDQLLTLSPMNQVVTAHMPPPSVNVYPLGHRDPANLLYRFILPLGRGFSELLTRIDSVAEAADGSLNVSAWGHLFSIREGRWTLRIDPALAYLVTDATYTPQGGIKGSSIRCNQAAGILPGTVPICPSGTFDLATHYPISVSVFEYSDCPQEGHQKTVSDAVNSGLEKSTVLDYTRPDNVGRPLVSGVRVVQ